MSHEAIQKVIALILWGFGVLAVGLGIHNLVNPVLPLAHFYSIYCGVCAIATLGIFPLKFYTYVWVLAANFVFLILGLAIFAVYRFNVDLATDLATGLGMIGAVMLVIESALVLIQVRSQLALYRRLRAEKEIPSAWEFLTDWS